MRSDANLSRCLMIGSLMIAVVLIVVACSQPGRRSQVSEPISTPTKTSSLGSYTPGDYAEEIVVDGQTRQYRLHIPPGYQPGQPLPLVINFHGFNSNAAQQEQVSRMSAKADQVGFIVVHPEGLGSPQTWHVGPRAEGAADLQFIRNLLHHLQGAIPPGPCPSSLFMAQPIKSFPTTGPYPYEGQGRLLLPAREWAVAWAVRNGCNTTSEITFQHGEVTGETWGNCREGAEVTLYTIKGRGHSWPGSDMPPEITTQDKGLTGLVDERAEQMGFFSRNSLLKWLYPGLGVKRWLLLLGMGGIVIGISLGYLLRDLYETWAFSPAFYHLTLQFLPYSVGALLLGVAGLSAIVIAIWQLAQSPLRASLHSSQESTVGAAHLHQQISPGPKIVAIGGGTGLSTLLRGLKEYTADITAIVTVADDGGSSGRLRRELGLLPPGDFRNCIAALADAEPLTTQLFQYRFGAGEGLDGHSFGNLFIAAMAGVTGNFERAILESSRVLAVRGQIVPSTLQNVTLCADLRGEDEALGQLSRVEGESRIPEAGLPIERVFLRPEQVRAYPGALRAILNADLILAGPGSLYTSILPNLLVEDITQAIRASQAVKMYICNVATQAGETDHFTVDDHMQALQDHVGKGVFHYILANDNFDAQLPPQANIEFVPLIYETTGEYQVITADLIDLENAWRHDSKKLARKVIEFYHQQRGHRAGEMAQAMEIH